MIIDADRSRCRVDLALSAKYIKKKKVLTVHLSHQTFTFSSITELFIRKYDAIFSILGYEGFWVWMTIGLEVDTHISPGVRFLGE